jgi:predicted nucleic acid-binding protein
VTWLLDTCVISEFTKPRPSAHVIEWLSGCDEDTLFLSVLTVGELERGIARLPPSAKRASLERWLQAEVVQHFGPRVLPISPRIATVWGQIAGGADAKGQPLPVIDALIAATSIVNNCTVVTRNTIDFERSGARCFDPWPNQ